MSSMNYVRVNRAVATVAVCLAMGIGTVMADNVWTGSDKTSTTSRTGSVGIGTSTVGSKLQVSGNSAIGYSSSTAAPSNGLAVSGNVGVGTTTIGSKLQVNGNSAIGYSSSTAAPSNGLAVSGNTGIGITNPSCKLHVNGAAAVGFSAAQTVPTNGLLVNGNVGIGTTTASGKLSVYSANTTQPAISATSYNGGPVVVIDGQGSTGSALVVYGPDMSGRSAEFWGDVLLEDNMNVMGTIQCSSLQINNWTIEAPDYVFEKDYKLLSLKEVEKKISAEKHLPEVPSAAEMKKNGVNLSDLNMTLLKKVEELTLYMIEQNNKIESQNKKIEDLEKKISR